MVSQRIVTATAAAMLGVGARASRHELHPTRTAEVVVDRSVPPVARVTDAAVLPAHLRAAGTFTGTLMLAPDSICGYINGQAERPWACSETDTCGFATAQGGWCACCKGLSCSISQRACVDYNEYSTESKCGTDCENDSRTRKCTDSEYPYCGTLTFFSGIVDYACVNNNASTFTPVDTTYAGQVTNYKLTTVVFEADTTFTQAISSSSTSSASTTQETTSSSSSTPTPAPSGDNGGGSSSSTNIGAIVGGVVGGVALVALIAFGIWFMRSRQKKAAQHPAEAQAMMSPGGPGGGGAQTQSPYATGTTGYNNGNNYNNGYYNPDGTPAMGGPGYYQDPNKQGFQQNYAPTADSQRQSYQQGPVPSAWAQHTGGSASQHTGGSGGGGGQHQQTTYYEASGNPIGVNDPNPNHKGQLHELS